MKPCTRCKQVKPLSEFPVAKRASDGRGSRCNACMSEILATYRATPEGQAARRTAQAKYRNSGRGQAMNQANAQTPKARAKRREYAHTPKGADVMRQSRARYLEKIRQTREGELFHKAGLAVGHAVETDKLPPASSLFCSYCGAPATQYHHYLGYEKPYWLSVIPLCTACHHKTRRTKPQAEQP